MPETIVEKIYHIIRGSSLDDAHEDAEAIFEAVLDDMREWAYQNQEKLKGAGPQYILYAYAKAKGITNERVERSPERESKHWQPRCESWWSRHWRRNESL